MNLYLKQISWSTVVSERITYNLYNYHTKIISIIYHKNINSESINHCSVMQETKTIINENL